VSVGGIGFGFNRLSTPVILAVGQDGPDYQSISQGLSFKSKCIHPGCVAYNNTIYVTKGLGEIDIGVASATLVCPKCGYKADMSANCGFFLAQWRFTGITQEGETVHISGRTNTHEFYTWTEGDNTNWRSLKVQVDAYTP
jgi:hypothetical protein